MRRCKVFVNGIEAGILSELKYQQQYSFRYNKKYISEGMPPVSLTLPLTEKEYLSPVLFPFFFNLLSEGENRAMQSSIHHIDMHDDFGILLNTAQYDTVGAVTIEPIYE